jgi:hypothetical protein
MRPTTIHTGAWRYPGAYPDANFNLTHIKRFAQTLERGKFDAFFMADHLAVLNMPIDALKHSHTVTSFEPFERTIWQSPVDAESSRELQALAFKVSGAMLSRFRESIWNAVPAFR